MLKDNHNNVLQSSDMKVNELHIVRGWGVISEYKGAAKCLSLNTTLLFIGLLGWLGYKAYKAAEGYWHYML